MTTLDTRTAPAPEPDPDRPAKTPLAAVIGDRKPAAVDTTEPILPGWLRDRLTFSVTARNYAERNLYRASRFLLHLPVILAWLVIYSPRGLGRLVGALSRYLYDNDSARVRATHAGNTETADYAKVQNIRKANLKARWIVAGTIGVVLAVPALAWTFPSVLAVIVAVAVFVWIVKLIPGRGLQEVLVAGLTAAVTWWFLPALLVRVPQPPAWPLWSALVVSVLGLGWHGRARGKSLVKSTTLAAGIVEPIRAPMVTAALCTLGNAKMTEKTQENPATAIRLLMDVARQGAGYQVDVELPAGVPASFVQEKREQLAAALRRELGCVFPSVGKRHPGHLSLYISDEPMSSAKQAPWALAKEGVVNLFSPSPLFTSNVGQWVTQRIAYTSWVVGAVPRMGKTFFVRQFGLVAGLDVRAKVLAFDLKGTGDLSPLALFAHAYSVGDEPEDIEIQMEHMRWVREEMRRRTKLVRDLTLEENPEKGKVTDALASKNPGKFGPIVVLVDECQVWFEEHPDKAVRDEFIALCRDLVKRGPALGIICLFATQKPDAKAIPSSIADNASARVAFKVNGQVSNDQILGTSSYQTGVRATQFGFEDKGVALFKGDGADPLIVRSVHGLDAVAAEKIALRARLAREGKGLLTGDAAGEEMEREEQQVSLLEDARTAMGETKAMLLDELREVLTALRAGTWGHLDNEALGSMLNAAGVKRGTVWSAGRKCSGYGIKREWLDVSTTANVTGDEAAEEEANDLSEDAGT